MNSEEYKAKTDEEIIELIHKGEDKYAQEYMLVKYKPLVMACSKSCFISGAEKDDVIQEGMIGLYKAIRDFVAERKRWLLSPLPKCVLKDRLLQH